MKRYHNNLSSPTKMPCPSFDLGVWQSGCHKNCAYGKMDICYAKNNPHELMPSRIKLLKRNMRLIKSDNFVTKLKRQIIRSNAMYFRFFSSGDFTTMDSFTKIIKLCSEMPNVKFWIPTTREDLLAKYVTSGNKIPDNVCIRLSNPVVNSPMPEAAKSFWRKHGITFSETSTNKKLVNCHASVQKKNAHCDICRKCWDRENETTVYKIHGQRAKTNMMKMEVLN